MIEMSRFSYMYLIGTALGLLTVIGAFMSAARAAPYVWAGIKKVPYDWLLSVLAFIGGLVTVGYGIGNMATVPTSIPTSMCSDGLRDDQLRRIATDSSADAAKVQAICAYAKERDQMNRQHYVGISTQTMTGSWLVGWTFLLGGVGIAVVGFVMWCRKLTEEKK